MQIHVNVFKVIQYTRVLLSKENPNLSDPAKAQILQDQYLWKFEAPCLFLYLIPIDSIFQFIVCLVLIITNFDTCNNDNSNKDTFTSNFEFLTINLIISVLMSFYIFSTIIYSFFLVARSIECLSDL